MFTSILSSVLGWYQDISEITKANPIVGGAVMVWLLGTVTLLLRGLPRRLWNFISLQCTTAVTLNNAGWSGNEAIFKAFMSWYTSTKWVKFSRRLSLESKDYYGERSVIGPGFGLHIFFFENKLFWFTKGSLDSSGSEKQKEIINIYTFGRKSDKLTKLIAHFTPKRDNHNKTTVYAMNNDRQWSTLAVVRKRPFESVILAKEVKDNLTSRLDSFYNDREWYLSKGLNHKLCAILHGKPGTGKTSIIKALAGKYDADVYSMNLSQMSDVTFGPAIAAVPPGSFILIEDFDSASAVKSRKPALPALLTKEVPLSLENGNSHKKSNELVSGDLVESESSSEENNNSDSEFFSMLTLSTVLNSLDGIVGLDNTVIFMTTNHLEKIDSAITRKGRTDIILELDYLKDESIKEYIQYVYGNDKDLSKYTFKPIAGCDLQDALLVNKQNFDGFIESLKNYIV